MVEREYKIWHGEHQTFATAKSISAISPKEAMKSISDSKFKINKTIDDRWIAINESQNDDYYFIVKQNKE
jgi:hypothetical protein